MVLVSHFWPRTEHASYSDFIVERMSFGVEIFFVVSGFLITYLLLNEEQKHGSVSIANFYFRRFLRIVPPLYCYLLALIFLTATNYLITPTQDIFSSAFFLRNFFGTSSQTAHCWSLSVEEHFYLVWPCLFVMLGDNRLRLAFCLAIVLISPFWSHWIYKLAGGAEYANNLRTDLRLSGIAFGSGLACTRFTQLGSKIFQSHWLTSGWTVLATLVLVLSISFTSLSSLPVLRAFAPTIASAGVAVLLNAAIANARSWWVHVLDWQPVSLFGKMSYSIYLWQQMFIPNSDNTEPNYTRHLVWLLAAVASGIIAYWLIEKPMMRMRAIFRR